MKARVIITNLNFGQDYTDLIADLKACGYETDWVTPPSYAPADTVATVKGYDAIIAGGEKYDRWALEQLRDRLKIIVRHGTGVDNIDLVAASEFGIPVTNAPGRNARGVAEHALAMMLCLTRSICRFDDELRRQGIWRPGTTRELYGKTVGLLGFGSIARWLVALLKGFSCRILVHDPFMSDEAMRSHGAEPADIGTIARESDFVSLHMPLTEETEGSIGLDFFRAMKPTAYFINTARGKIIREPELVQALEEHTIAGAGLDVFYGSSYEAAQPFVHLDNVLLSPHTSAVTEESMVDMMDCSISDLAAFFEGRPLGNLLNPEHKEHR